MPWKTSITLFILLISWEVSASVVIFKGEPVKTFSESGIKVPVNPHALVKLPGVTPSNIAKVNLTGAGLREKTIVLFDVNVYIAAHYYDRVEKLSSKDPLADIRKSRVRLIQLTLLRDLSADKIRGAFADSLKENDIDMTDPAIQKFLKLITLDMKEGSKVTIVGYVRKKGAQGVIYELPQKTYTVRGPKIADQIWSIWFGKTTDGGLESLKRDLVGG